MNERTIRSVIAELVSEYTALSERIAADVQKATAMEKLLNAYSEAYPYLFSSALHPSAVPEPFPLVRPVGERPRGQEAIRLVMSDYPGRPWTVADMVAELDTRHWLPDSAQPAAAVRTAMDRLAATPEVDKGRGKQSGAVTYTWVEHYDPDDEETRAAQHDAARDEGFGDEGRAPLWDRLRGDA